MDRPLFHNYTYYHHPTAINAIVKRLYLSEKIRLGIDTIPPNSLITCSHY